MCESDDGGSVSIDLDDADTMALIEEMRNAEPSGEIKRKIDRHKIYMSRREERIEYNRRWRAEHQEHRKAYDREYGSRPEVKARNNERKRAKYHSDPEYRAKVLAKCRARRAAWSPERRADESRKQVERQRKRRARKRAERAKMEARNARVRAIQAAWTPEQRAEYNRKQRERKHALKARKAAENE